MPRTSWIAATLLVSSACGGAQPPPFKPLADTKLLMEAVLEPQANVVWRSVGTIIDAAGEQNVRPKTQEEWTAVRDAAVVVAESGNLLMMVPRAKDAEWMQIAQTLVDTSAKAVRAADARNVDQIFDVGAEMYEVCVSCHSKYMEAITQATK